MEELLTIKEVKRMLGISYGVIIAHVQQGSIPAYKVTGEPVRRGDVTNTTTGLRFKSSDVREYLASVLVK